MTGVQTCALPIWHIYNKILACVAVNIYFHTIESYGALDFLIDECSSSIIFLNQAMRKYINTDSIEQKGASDILPDQNDAMNAT